jgi:hypothetical protein
MPKANQNNTITARPEPNPGRAVLTFIILDGALVASLLVSATVAGFMIANILEGHEVARCVLP